MGSRRIHHHPSNIFCPCAVDFCTPTGETTQESCLTHEDSNSMFRYNVHLCLSMFLKYIIELILSDPSSSLMLCLNKAVTLTLADMCKIRQRVCANYKVTKELLQLLHFIRTPTHSRQDAYISIKMHCKISRFCCIDVRSRD